jgi:nicotinate-nucleotide adenylyltransferase
MLTVALFGTSADPPTAGHQQILAWLSRHYDLVAVWAADNPFKDHQTSLEHRQKMLQLLIQEIPHPRQNIFLKTELSDRRSLISLEKARQLWGEQAQYTLVIGSDLVAQIRRWYRIEELWQKANLVIIPRTGYPIKKEDIQALEKLGAKCRIADIIIPDISSTAFRTCKDTNVVTPRIQDYIQREKLYA